MRVVDRRRSPDRSPGRSRARGIVGGTVRGVISGVARDVVRRIRWGVCRGQIAQDRHRVGFGVQARFDQHRPAEDGRDAPTVLHHRRTGDGYRQLDVLVLEAVAHLPTPTLTPDPCLALDGPDGLAVMQPSPGEPVDERQRQHHARPDRDDNADGAERAAVDRQRQGRTERATGRRQQSGLDPEVTGTGHMRLHLHRVPAVGRDGLQSRVVGAKAGDATDRLQLHPHLHLDRQIVDHRHEQRGIGRAEAVRAIGRAHDLDAAEQLARLGIQAGREPHGGVRTRRPSRGLGPLDGGRVGGQQRRGVGRTDGRAEGLHELSGLHGTGNHRRTRPGGGNGGADQLAVVHRRQRRDGHAGGQRCRPAGLSARRDRGDSGDRIRIGVAIRGSVRLRTTELGQGRCARLARPAGPAVRSGANRSS